MSRPTHARFDSYSSADSCDPTSLLTQRTAWTPQSPHSNLTSTDLDTDQPNTTITPSQNLSSLASHNTTMSKKPSFTTGDPFWFKGTKYVKTPGALTMKSHEPNGQTPSKPDYSFKDNKIAKMVIPPYEGDMSGFGTSIKSELCEESHRPVTEQEEKGLEPVSASNSFKRGCICGSAKPATDTANYNESLFPESWLFAEQPVEIITGAYDVRHSYFVHQHIADRLLAHDDFLHYRHHVCTREPIRIKEDIPGMQSLLLCLYAGVLVEGNDRPSKTTKQVYNRSGAADLCIAAGFFNLGYLQEKALLLVNTEVSAMRFLADVQSAYKSKHLDNVFRDFFRSHFPIILKDTMRGKYDFEYTGWKDLTNREWLIQEIKRTLTCKIEGGGPLASDIAAALFQNLSEDTKSESLTHEEGRANLGESESAGSEGQPIREPSDDIHDRGFSPWDPWSFSIGERKTTTQSDGFFKLPEKASTGVQQGCDHAKTTPVANARQNDVVWGLPLGISCGWPIESTKGAGEIQKPGTTQDLKSKSRKETWVENLEKYQNASDVDIHEVLNGLSMSDRKPTALAIKDSSSSCTLGFLAGDIISNIKPVPSGWGTSTRMIGQAHGAIGDFPASYVRLTGTRDSVIPSLKRPLIPSFGEPQQPRNAGSRKYTTHGRKNGYDSVTW